MTKQEKLNLVTNYFAEDWAIEKAMQLLEDYEEAPTEQAEVRKQDEALILQLVEALENHDGNYKLSKSAGAAVNAAITAARARLGETT